MVDILPQQNAVGFDSTENMETDKPETEQKPTVEKEELDEGELPEEGEITEDEEEMTPVNDVHTSSTRSRGHSSSHRHRSHHSPPRSSHSKPSHSSPSKPSKSASKYKDFDGKTTKPSGGEEVMMESWLNGVQKKRRASPIYDSTEDYYGTKMDDEQAGDENKIQPELMDEYGDVDYRQQIDDSQKRTRRRSSSPVDSFGTMAKRPRNDMPPEEPQFPLPRRGPIRNKWTEKTMCKFFREGFCRDLENCAYSHDAKDSHRRPELCRFYAQGFCKRGLACPNLHGEWPCKAFNKGECSKEQCNFSHQPLNDYTTPIFEQMMRDEELAMKLLNNAGIRPRRRILLADGPEEWDTYFNEESVAETRLTVPQTSVAAPAVSNGAQPKPAPSTTAAPTSASSYGFFNAVPSSHVGNKTNLPNTSPHQASQLPSTSQPLRLTSPPQNESFNLSDMLNFGQATTAKSAEPTGLSQSLIQDSLQSLQSMFDTNIVDESPRSPPMSSIVVSDSAPVIPITRSYIAYPLSIPDTSGNLDLNLIQQLTSGIYKNNDPRLKRLAEKQFDLVSKTFEQNNVQALLMPSKSSVAAPARQVPQAIPQFHPPPITAPSLKPADPRTRDPRTARAAASAVDPMQASYSPLSADADDFQSKVAQQLQMVEMAKQAGGIKSDDLDLRAAPSSHYNTSPREYFDRRHDAQQPPPFRGHPRATRGAARGRFQRQGEKHGDRYDERNWNESPSDSQATYTPKLSPPTRTSAESTPKDDQTSRPLTMREKRKDNQFESPLNSSSRRF